MLKFPEQKKTGAFMLSGLDGLVKMLCTSMSVTGKSTSTGLSAKEDMTDASRYLFSVLGHKIVRFGQMIPTGDQELTRTGSTVYPQRMAKTESSLATLKEIATMQFVG
jgi:hypothetical protein